MPTRKELGRQKREQRGLTKDLARGKKRETKLSERQRAMIDAYFGKANFNQKQAARMAGYGEGSIASSGKLFSHPLVRAEIERRQERNQSRYEATYDRLIEELSTVAFASLADHMEFDEETGRLVGINLSNEDVRALGALGEVKIETVVEGDDAETVRKVTVKPWNKLQAIDMLMRHLGVSQERRTVDVNININQLLDEGRQRVRRGNLAPVVDAEYEEVGEGESRDS